MVHQCNNGICRPGDLRGAASGRRVMGLADGFGDPEIGGFMQREHDL